MLSKYRKESIKNWTRSAKDCYSIGCNCEICSVYHKYFKYSKDKCQMKDYVFESVRKFGAPEDVEPKTIIEEEEYAR